MRNPDHMSARVLLISLFTLASALVSQAENRAPLSVYVGEQEIIRGPYADEDDTAFNEVHLSSGKYRGFTSNGTTYAVDGSTPKAMGGPRVPVRRPGTPGSFDECGNWLNGTFVSGERLFGVFHSESRCRQQGGGGVKSMSLGVSDDEGISWTPLGQIISGEEDLPKPGNVTGEGDCVVANPPDGYVYLYCLRASDFQTIAARAPINNPLPGEWKKWDGHDWASPGLHGHGASIQVPNFGPVMWIDTQHLMLQASIDTREGGLALSISNDFIHFTEVTGALIPIKSQTWQRPAPPELYTYLSLIAPEKDHDHLILSYTYLPPNQDFSHRYLAMRDLWLRWKQ